MTVVGPPKYTRIDQNAIDEFFALPQVVETYGKESAEEFRKVARERALLSVSNDNQLPKWALEVLSLKGFSRKFKVMCLLWHSAKITEYRRLREERKEVRESIFNNNQERNSYDGNEND